MGSGHRSRIAPRVGAVAVALLLAAPALWVLDAGTAAAQTPPGDSTTTSTTVAPTTTTTVPPSTVPTTTTVPPPTTSTTRPPRSTTTTSSSTTTTTTPVSKSTSSSTPWGLIALIVVLVIAIVVVVLLLRSRRRKSAEEAWRRAVVPALSDAQLARDSLLSGNATSADPELRGAVTAQAERAAVALDGAASSAPDPQAASAATSVAAALRGLAFAVEADRLLRQGTSAPSGVQLAEADEAKRARNAELSAALTRLSTRIGSAPHTP